MEESSARHVNRHIYGANTSPDGSMLGLIHVHEKNLAKTKNLLRRSSKAPVGHTKWDATRD